MQIGTHIADAVGPVAPVGGRHGGQPGTTIRGCRRPAFVLASGHGPQIAGVVDEPVAPVHGSGGLGQTIRVAVTPVAPVAGSTHTHAMRSRAAGWATCARASQITTQRRMTRR
jgi:hypothetical protein